MSDRKILFKDRPNQGIDGQYTYLTNNFSSNYFDSDGRVDISDKFTGRDLYSTVVSDETNEAIMDSNLDMNAGINDSNGDIYDALLYDAQNFIKIDSITFTKNPDNADSGYTLFRAYIFDDNTFSIKDASGNIKNARELYQQIAGFQTRIANSTSSTAYYNGVTPSELVSAKFWEWEIPPEGGKRTVPGGQDIADVDPTMGGLVGATILTDLGNSPPTEGGYTNYHAGFNPGNAAGRSTAFNPSVTGITSFLDENNTGNDIYIAIATEGHQRESGHFDRRNARIQIFTIPISEIFDYDDVGNALPKLATFSFTNGISHQYNTATDGGADVPLVEVTELTVSFNTLGNQGADYQVNPKYNPYRYAIQPQMWISTDEASFQTEILNAHPYREIKNSTAGGWYESLDVDGVNELSDYLPVPTVTVSKTDRDLQVYYESDFDRQIASAPGNINLNFYVSNVEDFNSGQQSFELVDRNSMGIRAGAADYLFYVVDWDDIDDKYNSLIDVMDDGPKDVNELLARQSENLYKYSTLNRTLVHNYSTPGVKKIKAVMFNYQVRDDNKFEPLRWKFISIRFYLDIPISAFPDFGELGGAEYTTIPWPYTTPIIGGMSDDSKYHKSIRNILGGGKIGDTDVIDENSLFNAQNNNELGKNVEKLDLEQVRYFNKSYDMNQLLNIPPSYTDTGLADNVIGNFYLFNAARLSQNETTSTMFLDSHTHYINLYNPDNPMYNEGHAIFLDESNTKLRFYGHPANGHANSVIPINSDTHFANSLLALEESYNINLGWPPAPATTWNENDSRNFQMKIVGVNETLISFLTQDITIDNHNVELLATATDMIGSYVRFNIDAWNADEWGTEFQFSDGPSPRTMYKYSADITVTDTLYTGNLDDFISEWYAFNTNNQNLIKPDYYFIVELKYILPTLGAGIGFYPNPYTDISGSLTQTTGYWDGETNKFPEESSVGQIFINDNKDDSLINSCQLELNTGNLTSNIIDDSSGNVNKGLLIGDYNLKKTDKGEPMRRDSYINTPKNSTEDGAL